MVVRNIVGNIPPAAYQFALEHNLDVFRGIGDLGGDFVRALAKSEPYAGLRYVEALINSSTGAIESITMPNPNRFQQEELFPDSDRNRAVFLVDALRADKILDVIARDELIPEARACLQASVNAAQVDPASQKIAA